MCKSNYDYMILQIQTCKGYDYQGSIFGEKINKNLRHLLRSMYTQAYNLI